MNIVKNVFCLTIGLHFYFICVCAEQNRHKQKCFLDFTVNINSTPLSLFLAVYLCVDLPSNSTSVY